MGGDGQPAQQPLQTLTRERQIEVLLCCVCVLFQAERRHMAQAWADYPDSLRRGADVLPFKTRRTR